MMRPLKILLASSSSGSRGGGELWLLYLGRALVERGNEVMLWTSTHPRMDELAQSFAAFGKVIRSPYRNTYDRTTRSVAAFLDRKTARDVAAEWKRCAPDIIHINKQNLEDGLELLRAAQFANLPSICMIHITQDTRYLKGTLASVRDFVSKRALNQYRGVLVTNPESRKRDLVRFLGRDRAVEIIPNGVPVFDLSQRERMRAAKRTELELNSSDFVVVAVGRLVPQKRPMLFLQLASEIHARIPQARFVWVGDGELATEWDAEVKARHLSQVVQRTGWQSEVLPFLFSADLFLHVADFEGLSFAVLEALSAGLPCAVTRNLLSEMSFLNDSNSIAVDEDSASGAWIEKLRDRAALERIGGNARKLIEERFSFAQMARNYEELYRRAVAAGAAPTA